MTEARQTRLALIGETPWHDGWLRPGDFAPFGREGFERIYDPLCPMTEAQVEVRVLLGWVCRGVTQGCAGLADGFWARVRFSLLPKGTRFDGAESIELTFDEVARAHFAEDSVFKVLTGR